MHTASKVMLILGAVITVAGIVMFAVGSSAVDWDPIGNSEYSGSTGNFDASSETWYTVYSEQSSCDSVTYSITDANGDSAIESYECDDSMYDVNGYISLGGLYGSTSYTVESTSHTVYYSDSLAEVGEAVGGFMAVLGSFGVLCCGGFFLLLGGIFALTLKDPAVVMVAGGVPQQMMGAQQYAQPMQQQAAPVQQQAAPVQQQYQQPPQGGL